MSHEGEIFAFDIFNRNYAERFYKTEKICFEEKTCDNSDLNFLKT